METVERGIQKLISITDQLEKRVDDLQVLERPQLIEYHVPAYRTQVGASAPTLANRAVGASGNVRLPVAQFSSVTQQDVYFVFHVPEECDDTQKIFFHIMWLPGASWSSGNYMMKLEYLVKTETDPYNTGTPTTLSFNVTPADATHIVETEDSTGITVNRDEMVFCHFYRDVSADNGNDTLDVIFFEFEYHVR